MALVVRFAGAAAGVCPFVFEAFGGVDLGNFRHLRQSHQVEHELQIDRLRAHFVACVLVLGLVVKLNASRETAAIYETPLARL